MEMSMEREMNDDPNMLIDTRCVVGISVASSLS